MSFEQNESEYMDARCGVESESRYVVEKKGNIEVRRLVVDIYESKNVCSRYPDCIPCKIDAMAAMKYGRK